MSNNYQEKCLNQTSKDEEQGHSNNQFQARKGGYNYNDRGLNEKTMMADYENPLRKSQSRKNFQNNPYIKPDNKWSDNRIYNNYPVERQNNTNTYNKNNNTKNKNFRKKRKDHNFNTENEDFYFNTANSNNFNNVLNSQSINSNHPLNPSSTLNNINSTNSTYKVINYPTFNNNQINNNVIQNYSKGQNQEHGKSYYKHKENRTDFNKGDAVSNQNINTSTPNNFSNNSTITQPQYNKNLFSKNIHNSNKFNPYNNKQTPVGYYDHNLSNNNSILTVGSNTQTNYNSNELNDELNSSKTLSEVNTSLLIKNDPEQQIKPNYFNYEMSPGISEKNDNFSLSKTNNFNAKHMNFSDISGNFTPQPNMQNNYRTANNNVNFNQQNFFLLYDQNLVKNTLPQNININNNIIFPQDQKFNQNMMQNKAPFTQQKYFNNNHHQNVFPQQNLISFIPPVNPNFPHGNHFIPNNNHHGNTMFYKNKSSNNSNNYQMIRPKVVGSDKNFPNNYFRNPIEVQRNNTKSTVPPTLSSAMETNIDEQTIHHTKSNINLAKYREKILEEINSKDNLDSSLSSEEINDEEEISTEQEKPAFDEDNLQVINLSIKIKEDNTQILKFTRNDDIQQRVKEFCMKNNVKNQLIKPIYEKVTQAIKALDSLLYSKLENNKMFQEAIEYLTTKEKWKSILNSIDNDELNTSCPNIHNQGKDIFVDKKETPLNKTFN